MPYKSYRREFVESQFTKLVYALETEGEVSVDEIKESLGTDYPPASSPGEPPHRRTGNLQRGVEHDVETTRYMADLSVFSNRPEDDPEVPSDLEFGSTRMQPRPFMGPAMENTAGRIKGRLEEALKV